MPFVYEHEYSHLRKRSEKLKTIEEIVYGPPDPAPLKYLRIRSIVTGEKIVRTGKVDR